MGLPDPVDTVTQKRQTFTHSQSVGKLHSISKPQTNRQKNNNTLSNSKKRLRNSATGEVHRSMVYHSNKSQSFNKDIVEMNDDQVNAIVKKNMRDYQRKGLLDIVDRDNHYQGCNTCIQQRQKQGVSTRYCPHMNQRSAVTTLQQQQIRGNKSSSMFRQHQGRPRSALKNGDGQNGQTQRPQTQLSLNQDSLNNSILKKQLQGQANPSIDIDLNLYSSQQHKFVQGSGKDALKSIVEIRKSLANPQLLSYKISSEQGNIWRNAYYLSTSIEESNVRRSLNSIQNTNRSPPAQDLPINKEYQQQQTIPSPRSAIQFQQQQTRNDLQTQGSFLERQSHGGSLSQRPASGMSRGGGIQNTLSDHKMFNNQTPTQQNPQQNVQAYLDFNAMSTTKKQQTPNYGSLNGGGAHPERQYSQKSLNQQNTGLVVNPCPMHIMNEIAFLDKTTKRGACSECIPELTKQNHELMPINATIFEIRDVMMNLESNMLDLLRQRTALLNDNRNKMSIIEADQSQFVQEQQNKINSLHNYLEDRLRTAINDYQKAIEPDTFKVKSNLNRLEDQISINKQFISEVQALKREFDNNTRIQNIVEKVSVAGNLLNQYNSLRSKQNDDQFETVYPNHLRDFLPVFQVNTDKELEIMANKFRVLTHHMSSNSGQFDGSMRSPTKQNILGAAPSSGFFNQAPFKQTNSLINSQRLQSPQQIKSHSESLYDAKLANQLQKDESFEDMNIETREDILNNNLKEAIKSGQNIQKQGNMTQQQLNTQASNMLRTSTQRQTGLFENPQVMRRKIKILRWLSRKIGEYDIDNDFWRVNDAQVDRPFLAFSRTIYLPNQDMIVIGGLDDFIPNKPTFSAQCILISEVPLNSYDNLYVQNPLKSMISKRGCFSAIFHEGFIFVMGGLNYTEKILKKCERYSIADDRWDHIADMQEPRKNSSACALTTDTIYVFGGSSQSQSSDTIEQYSIATNTWNLLKIKLPSPISFVTSFKMSQTQIILLGGSVKEHSRRAQTYKTNQVLVFDVIQPKFTRVKNLEKDLISLYPAFFDSGTLFLIDEDGDNENPPIIRYDMSYLLQNTQYNLE